MQFTTLLVFPLLTSQYPIKIMTPIRLLAPALLSFAFISCAVQKSDSYDTVNTTAASVPVTTPTTPPVNPVYDTPAAYEETSATAITPAPIIGEPGAIAKPNTPKPVIAKPNTNGAAIIHTVVAGDTLSGISSKYKVSTAAIKQANNMTKDTVVLGKKMVIPPVR